MIQGHEGPQIAPCDAAEILAFEAAAAKDADSVCSRQCVLVVAGEFPPALPILEGVLDTSVVHYVCCGSPAAVTNSIRMTATYPGIVVLYFGGDNILHREQLSRVAAQIIPALRQSRSCLPVIAVEAGLGCLRLLLQEMSVEFEEVPDGTTHLDWWDNTLKALS